MPPRPHPEVSRWGYAPRRLFAYGSLSVILVFYLVSMGLSESQTGLVLTLTLTGDLAVSLYLTTRADRIGLLRTMAYERSLVA